MRDFRHNRILFSFNGLHRNPDNRGFHYNFRKRLAMASTAVSKVQLTDKAVLRLLCLPYAGGGSAVYHRWRSAVPNGVDLVPLSLPGHDGRLHEPPCTDIPTLAAILADDVCVVLDRPYAVLGYSVGAWLAFELSRELRRRGDRLPTLLIAAASSPPHARIPEAPVYLLPDEELVATVERRYGGIPPTVRDSPELLQLLLPALRADLQMGETYAYQEEPPLETPIFALGGTEDAAVSAARLGEWRRHTSGEFSMRLFPGGHFFLFQGRSATQSRDAADRSMSVSPALRAIFAQLEHCMRSETDDSKLLD
jgi:surfactin synthase thioesterase subunit